MYSSELTSPEAVLFQNFLDNKNINKNESITETANKNFMLATNPNLKK